MRVPILPTSGGDRRMCVGAIETALGVRHERHRVMGCTIQIDIESPDGIVHMRHERVSRVIHRGGADASDEDAIVAKHPLDDVVVVAGAQRAPQRELLTTSYLRVVLPCQAAVAYFLANVCGTPEWVTADGGRAVRGADGHEAEREIRNVIKSMAVVMIGNKDFRDARLNQQRDPLRRG